MRINLLSILFLLFTVARECFPAQFPDSSQNGNFTFVGETLVYELTYLGLPAAELNLAVPEVTTLTEHRVFHLTAKVKTKAIIHQLFRIENFYESFFDTHGGCTYQLKKSIRQKNLVQQATINYDPEKGLATLNETASWTPPENWHDCFSLLYHLRQQPLQIGDEIHLPLDAEGIAWDAIVQVLGKESVKTPLGRFNAIKVQIHFQPGDQSFHRNWRTDLLTNRFASAGSTLLLWFDDQPRRMLLKLKYDLPVASVEMVLSKDNSQL